MKKIITLSLLIIIFLSGCSRFNKSYFLEESFGINLNQYISSDEATYSDGLLEISNISPTDEIYLEFFNNEDFTISENVYIASYKKTYSATEEFPFQYIILEKDSSNTFKNVILYIPDKKIMIFMYSHTLI